MSSVRAKMAVVIVPSLAAMGFYFSSQLQQDEIAIELRIRGCDEEPSDVSTRYDKVEGELEVVSACGRTFEMKLDRSDRSNVVITSVKEVPASPASPASPSPPPAPATP